MRPSALSYVIFAVTLLVPAPARGRERPVWEAPPDTIAAMEVGSSAWTSGASLMVGMDLGVWLEPISAVNDHPLAGDVRVTRASAGFEVELDEAGALRWGRTSCDPSEWYTPTWDDMPVWQKPQRVVAIVDGGGRFDRLPLARLRRTVRDLADGETGRVMLSALSIAPDGQVWIDAGTPIWPDTNHAMSVRITRGAGGVRASVEARIHSIEDALTPRETAASGDAIRVLEVTERRTCRDPYPGRPRIADLASGQTAYVQWDALRRTSDGRLWLDGEYPAFSDMIGEGVGLSWEVWRSDDGFRVARIVPSREISPVDILPWKWRRHALGVDALDLRLGARTRVSPDLVQALSLRRR